MQKKAELVKFISENHKLLKPLESEALCGRVMHEFKALMQQKEN